MATSPLSIQHVWSDAWLLLSAGMRLDREVVPLTGLLTRADGIQHAVPAFEEVDGGLARLVAAGLLAVGDGRVALTNAGHELLARTATARMPLHTWQSAIERELRATAWSAVYGPADAARDPAHQPVITRDEYDRAVRSGFPQ